MIRNWKRMGAVFMAAAVVMSAGAPAYGSTQEELSNAQQKKSEAESELQDMQSKIEALESKKGEAEAYLRELNDQLSELTEQLDDLQQQYSEKQQELDVISLELTEAQEDEEVQRKNMALRIQYMYENSSGTNRLASIFSAGDFTQMLNAATDFSQLESYDRKMLQDYIDSCKKVEEKKKEAEDQQKEIERVSAESEQKKSEIQQLCDETQQQVEEYAASIDSEEGDAARLIASIHEQQANIEGLERKAADEVAAADAAAKAQQEAAQQEAVQAAPQQISVPQTQQAAQTTPEPVEQAAPGYGSGALTRSAGRINGPSGEETYYNMDMSGVVQIMRSMGNNDEYWVRSDGVKMLGNYVMVAANLSVRPRGSLVATSLGTGIVCDTGGFAISNPTQLDIATAW
uniref:murein hydrolase activator EnvC family protein n=1 Tax=Eubacterium cellulosolvens TaxID=29322 RepID=UPI0004861CB7|nr:hypothetical protein [[Eubacterium] cellulosolvens]